MSFLSPLFALLGLLAVPILLLYMLKLRRQDVEVSSTMLWQMVVQDRQANIPWQRLRRNLLLFVQLLILAALVFALLRPALPSDAISNAEVIIILDASASMQATDVEPTRFEAAKKEIERIITNLPPQSELTLIQIAEQSTILIAHSNNKQEMRRALNAASLTSGEANWEKGFALANSAISKPDHILVLVSDGGLSQTTIPLYAEQIRYIPLGVSAANVGIAAFSITSSQEAGEIFVKVRNYGAAETSAILSILRDETLFQAERIRVPAGDDHIQIISDLPLETASYRAQLSSDVNAEKLDSYPLDDQAFIAFNPSTNQRILLISAGNFFLEQFLAALPDTEAYQVFPDDSDAETRLPAEGFAVYIYDGYIPDVLPDGGILLINPPANPLFDVGPATVNYGQVAVSEHPLTQFVEWEAVQILQTKAVIAPSWAEILIDSDAGPLVFVGEIQSRPIAVVSFDLLDSDLPLQITFPILFSNLLTWLNPPAIYDALDGYQVGDAVQLKPGPGVEELGITFPDGTEEIISLDEYGATFLGTQQAGLYSVAALPGGQTEQFAVNAFSDLESAIAPKETLSLLGQNPASDPRSQQDGLREIWPYLAALALLLLVLEWWLHHRQNRLVLAKLWQRGQSQ